MYSSTIKYFEESDFINIKKLVNSFNFSLIVILILVFLKYAIKRKNYSKILPTRQMRFMNLYGHISDFVSISRFKEISLNAYVLQCFMGHRQIFKNEKFYTFWLSYSPFILLTKAEAVEAVIAGSKNLEKNWVYSWLHPWLGAGLITSHGNKWKSRRKLLTHAFHFDILKDFLPVLNEQSQILVKILEGETEQSWTDIVEPIKLCSLDIICETTLGVSVDAQRNSKSEYVKAAGRASEVFMKRMAYPPYHLDWYFTLSSVGIQFRRDVELLHCFTRKVIAEKKQELLSGNMECKAGKRKALMDILLEQHIQKETFSEEDVREEVDTFTFAGHDTTSMGISWALYLIGLYKDVQEKLYEELFSIFGDDTERLIALEDLKDMEYLERVLKESQRLYPSVPFFSRQLTDDINIDGYDLPKGAGVSVLVYCIHRDETVYPNPEVFDPDRFLPEFSANRHPFAFIPFSAGPRNCIGQRFAIMEEKVVIANILRNYSLESLDPRDKVIPVPELILRASGPIKIKFKRR